MFSKACEYAIRSMMFVAQKSKNGERAGAREIAENIDSPDAFIGKILQELTRKGLLQSAKGPNGGFYLDDKGLKTSLADIVRAIDGNQLFVGCGLGLKACSEKRPCPLHNQFKAIRNNIQEMLEQNTVGEFSEELDSKVFHLKRN